MKTLNFCLIISVCIGQVACGHNTASVEKTPGTTGLSREGQTRQNLSEVSRVTWEICNVFHILSECSPPSVTEHWGTVTELKLFKTGTADARTVRPYIKSNGCTGTYNAPGPRAWYPLSPPARELRGKIATARIIESRPLNERERKALVIYKENIAPNLPPVDANSCRPLADNAKD